MPVSSPTRIVARASSATTISVSWQPPKLQDRNGVIISYAISYFMINTSSDVTFQVNGLTTIANISLLKPFTSYSIRIKAATIIGFGPYSSTFTVTTDQAGRLFQLFNSS